MAITPKGPLMYAPRLDMAWMPRIVNLDTNESLDVNWATGFEFSQGARDEGKLTVEVIDCEETRIDVDGAFYGLYLTWKSGAELGPFLFKRDGIEFLPSEDGKDIDLIRWSLCGPFTLAEVAAPVAV